MNDEDNIGNCPICGHKLMRVWGFGWDWDRAICSFRGCDYEKELDVSTGKDPDGSVFRMRKPKDEEQ